MAKVHQAFPVWRKWPAPERDEVVKQIGDSLRDKKVELGYFGFKDIKIYK